jgi:ABC-type glycerol-3-phosphate transport system substrate-binding protein
MDERSVRLQELFEGAPAIVLPPDTGYDLKRANALYAAEAAVLGGQQSPADALAALDAELAQ